MRGYDENKKIDIENYRNRRMGRGIHINGQGQAPYHRYHFGLGTSGKNGCLAFAIYNCNISLGLYDNISSIIREIFRYGGMVMGGYLGANPWVIYPYYRSRGCKMKLLLVPSSARLEKMMQINPTGILMFLWWGRGLGSHYVAMERKDAGKYYVYNEYNRSSVARKYDSMKSFRGGKNLPLLYVSVKKCKD